MNKKFVGAALVVTAVGGYVYYQYKKAQVDKVLDLMKEKVEDAFMQVLAPVSYPEPDPEEDKVHG